MKNLMIASLLLMTSQVFATDVFLITKSIREKNAIHYDIKVKDCRMTDKALSAFWILGEKSNSFQALTKEEIPKYAPEVIRENGQELEFTVPVFSELNDRSVEKNILVKLINCRPKAFVKIDGNEYELNEIHAKISIFKMGVKYILIKTKKPNGQAFKYKVDV